MVTSYFFTRWSIVKIKRLFRVIIRSQGWQQASEQKNPKYVNYVLFRTLSQFISTLCYIHIQLTRSYRFTCIGSLNVFTCKQTLVQITLHNLWFKWFGILVYFHYMIGATRRAVCLLSYWMHCRMERVSIPVCRNASLFVVSYILLAN